MLNKAIEIANITHAGQKDLGGENYILHPIRVMMAVEFEIYNFRGNMTKKFEGLTETAVPRHIRELGS